MPKGNTNPMSEDHKVAMSVGRTQGRAVRRYLEALEATKPKRGRKRTRQTVERHLENVDRELKSATALRRLELIQERYDLANELKAFDEAPDMDAVEKEFISVARDYAERRGISYSAFREMGVPVKVLRQAGMSLAKHK